MSNNNLFVQFGFPKENSSFDPEINGVDGEIFVNSDKGTIHLGKKLIGTNVGKKTNKGEIFNDPNNRADGLHSHAEGIGTETTNDGEHASGKYNKSSANTLFSVGSGTEDNRKNAFEITNEGDAIVEHDIHAQRVIIEGATEEQMLLGNGDLKDVKDFIQKTDNVGVSWTIVIPDQGYKNAEVISKITNDYVTISFDKYLSSSPPAYYTAGNSIRVYAKNRMTFSGNVVFTKIVFKFGSGDGTNAILNDVGEFSNNIWTGKSNIVTFTIDGTSKHRRINEIYIEYDVDGGGNSFLKLFNDVEKLKTDVEYIPDHITDLTGNTEGFIKTFYIKTVEDAVRDNSAYVKKIFGQSEFIDDEIVSCNITRINSIGLNQFNEEWIESWIEKDGLNTPVNINLASEVQLTSDEDLETGFDENLQTVSEESKPRSSKKFVSDYILVIPNTDYHCTNSNIKYWEYDINKIYLPSESEEPYSLSGNSFKTSKNCHYIKIGIEDESLMTTNTCLNISKSAINGMYQPFKKEYINIPIKKYFINGLHSLDGVYDEIDFENNTATNRLKQYNQFNLNWRYIAPSEEYPHGVWYTELEEYKVGGKLKWTKYTESEDFNEDLKYVNKGNYNYIIDSRFHIESDYSNIIEINSDHIVLNSEENPYIQFENKFVFQKPVINIPDNFIELDEVGSAPSTTMIRFPNSVETIGNNLNLNHTDIVIYLGENIKSIGDHLSRCYEIKLHCSALIPPIISEDTFLSADELHKPNSYIRVPYQSVDLYKQAPIWSNYSDIIKPVYDCPKSNEIWYKTNSSEPINWSESELIVISDDYIKNDYLHIVKFENDLDIIPERFLEGRDDLEEIYLPDSVTSIGNKAFNDCWDLWKIRLPKNLISIGDDAFVHTAISNWDYPNTLEYIGTNNFNNAVGKIEFPKSLKILKSIPEATNIYFYSSNVPEISEELIDRFNQVKNIWVNEQNLSSYKQFFGEERKIKTWINGSFEINYPLIRTDVLFEVEPETIKIEECFPFYAVFENGSEQIEYDSKSTSVKCLISYQFNAKGRIEHLSNFVANPASIEEITETCDSILFGSSSYYGNKNDLFE